MKSLLNPWILVLVAGLFEVAWAVGLKHATTSGRLLSWGFVVVTYLLSVFLLALAMRSLPVGAVYAVWTGIGAFGTAVIGMWLLNEPFTLGRVMCLIFIAGGAIGLKVLH